MKLNLKYAVYRAGSLELALSSLPLPSNFLGGDEISSLVVVRAFSSASPSPVHAGEGDVSYPEILNVTGTKFKVSKLRKPLKIKYRKTKHTFCYT